MNRKSSSLLPLLFLSIALAGCSEPVEQRRRIPTTPDPEAVAELAEPPKVWFEYERDTEDFGDVYQAAVRATTFEMVAAGEGDIVLGELRRTCGCTEGEMFVVAADGTKTRMIPGEPYAPGTRFELLASLNTRGRQGTQEQKVHLDLEGHTVPTTFTLKAEIVTFLELDPPQLAIDEASTLQGASGQLAVQSRNGELHVLSVRESVLPDELEVDITPVDPDEEGRAARWELAFRISPGMPKGPYKRKLMLVTDALNMESEAMPNGDQPVHTGELWIRCEMDGVFDIRPERLNFGRLRPGQGVVKKVIIRSRDEDFEMSGLDVALFERSGELYANADDFEIKSREIDPGRAWEVEIKLKSSGEGSMTGLLGIRTFHALEDEIVVPFLGQGPSN